jgi:DNA mismatch repair protein MutS
MSAAGSGDGIVSQFIALKRETDAEVLAMQCGDFYEFFGEDAELVGEELDLALSEKGAGDRSYPMAGVPLSELAPYLKALVERGYRVAVADQVETNDGFRREIERVATPGTLLETTDAEAQYLAAVVQAGATPGDGAPDGQHRNETQRNDGDEAAYGLAFADVTTGRFRASELMGWEAVRTECYRFAPAEIVPGPGVSDQQLNEITGRLGTTVSAYDDEAFAPGRARHRVAEQFGSEATTAVGLSESARRAAGAILTYVEDTGTGVLASMTRLGTYGEGVNLDATTQRNLELTATMHGSREGSLLGTIDHTETSAGGRLLRERLTQPLGAGDIEALGRRQDRIEALRGAALAHEELREILGETYDIARLASRVVSGSAGPGELCRVRDTLAVLGRLEAAIADSRLADSPVAGLLSGLDHERIEALAEELRAALAEDPPATVSEGGVIKQGYDDDIDTVVSEYNGILDWLTEYETREKEAHGITHLRVDRNKTDGYYIQVGNSETDAVPPEYDEVKTLKNARRYRTTALAERERELLRLEERRTELERAVFEAVRERVGSEAELLQNVGRALARLDVACSLAVQATHNDWVRPAFGESGIDIEAGRHPVVENTTEFVPNDARLGEDRSLVLVTGPNMSGKSTYMRQTALIVLLAQIGSFVPARAATIEPVDGIFTRVGALDELAQGRSTFMVEMAELSNILHSATADSLVILDEVGRGTATYDGISIAWAASEYLHNEIGARTLFATHYHELTELADRLARAANVHVAVDEDESDGEVTFLRTIREGAADRSYGVHVAGLASVPEPVVGRASEVLGNLRAEKAIEARGGDERKSQQAVFDLGTGGFRDRDGSETQSASADGGRATDADEPGAESMMSEAERDVLDELRGADLNASAPLDLVRELQEWQRRLEGSEP